MRNQVWYIAVIVGFMCIVRFSLSAIAYVDPLWLMEQLNISAGSNIQMPYVVRVWAIRDIILALLVAFADKNTVKSLLLACVVIDATDILSAHLSGVAGLFNLSEVWSLKFTAIAALVPEAIALLLIIWQNQINVSQKTTSA
jgi:hypothetical protein